MSGWVRRLSGVNGNDPIIAKTFANHFQNRTKKLVYCSLLGAITAILQAAGGVGGLGYIFSIFATLPIIIAAILSLKYGVITYATTILLLVILQPSEIIVFPFTTGLLGIGIGTALKYFRNGWSVVFLGGLSLTVGIAFLLYLFHFPVLGPGISSNFNILMPLYIFLFSIIYSWIWMKIGQVSIRSLNRVALIRSN